jgi:hypothetical protein
MNPASPLSDSLKSQSNSSPPSHSLPLPFPQVIGVPKLPQGYHDPQIPQAPFHQSQGEPHQIPLSLPIASNNTPVSPFAIPSVLSRSVTSFNLACSSNPSDLKDNGNYNSYPHAVYKGDLEGRLLSGARETCEATPTGREKDISLA